MSKFRFRNTTLFDIKKATPTFLDLMIKYRKRNKMVRNPNKNYIIRKIDAKRQELEKEEKDTLFIYKEAKNMAKLEKELINTYGVKAKAQVYDTSKMETPFKLNKRYFFEPTELDTLENNKLPPVKKGILQLPLITENGSFLNKKQLLTLCNMTSLKKSSDININSQNTLMNTERSVESNKNSNADSNQKIKNLDSLSATDTNLCPTTFRNSKSDRNVLISDFLKKKEKEKKIHFRNQGNTLYYSNRNIFSYNGSYVNELSDLKDKLIKENNRIRNYFHKNDYGCTLFKEKYDFFNQKFFKSK